MKEQCSGQMPVFNDDVWGKWYVRYLSAILLVLLAFFCFRAYVDDVRLQGLFLLLINPIMGMFYAVAAVSFAWELMVCGGVLAIIGCLVWLVVAFPYPAICVLLILLAIILRHNGKIVDDYNRLLHLYNEHIIQTGDVQLAEMEKGRYEALD